MRSAFGARGAWGDDEVAGGSSPLPIPVAEIAQIAASAIEAAQDPVRRYEVLTTRARQARAAGNVAQAEIYEARARAWAYRMQEETGLKQSRAEWSALGKTALIGGVLLLLGTTVAILSGAFRRRRK